MWIPSVTKPVKWRLAPLTSQTWETCPIQRRRLRTKRTRPATRARASEPKPLANSSDGPQGGESAGDEPKSTELKFQLSFKARLWETTDRGAAVWLGYTQQSHWQILDAGLSRPFRETNYMPEIFGSFRPGVDFGGWQWNLLNFGYTHQSNGRSDPISRSWDRLFVEAAIERDNFVLLARAWTRITEADYEDDNPDIVDYYGHGEITGIYKWRDNSFTLMGRGNLSTGKGAAQFTWATRPLLGPLRGYVPVSYTHLTLPTSDLV